MGASEPPSFGVKMSYEAAKEGAESCIKIVEELPQIR
jgi:hypothetical protein